MPSPYENMVESARHRWDAWCDLSTPPREKTEESFATFLAGWKANDEQKAFERY